MAFVTLSIILEISKQSFRICSFSIELRKSFTLALLTFVFSSDILPPVKKKTDHQNLKRCYLFNFTTKRNLRFVDSFALGCLTVCVTGAGAGVDSARKQKKFEAKTLSKHSLCTLSPSSNFNVVFWEGVQRKVRTSLCFVRRFCFSVVTLLIYTRFLSCFVKKYR